MPREADAIRQPQLIHLLVDRLHIRPLPREHEGKRLSALRIAGTAFEDAQDVLLPVHLPAIEQNRFVRQVEVLLCRRCARLAGVDVRRAVWHDDHVADIAVVVERLLRALAHRPDLVAALIEADDGGNREVCEHLRAHNLIKIVVIARVEHADERDSAPTREASRLKTRDEGGVRVYDVQRNIPHARVIVRVQLGNAGAVLLLPRQLPADKVHQLKGVASAIAGVRHRGNHIALLAAAGERSRVVVYHAADAVDNRQEGIAKLSYLHENEHAFPSVVRF